MHWRLMTQGHKVPSDNIRNNQGQDFTTKLIPPWHPNSEELSQQIFIMVHYI